MLENPHNLWFSRGNGLVFIVQPKNDIDGSASCQLAPLSCLGTSTVAELAGFDGILDSDPALPWPVKKVGVAANLAWASFFPFS